MAREFGFKDYSLLNTKPLSRDGMTKAERKKANKTAYAKEFGAKRPVAAKKGDKPEARPQ